MDLSFNELRVANIRRHAEDKWRQLPDYAFDAWSLTDWACAFAGEAGEACNVVKKLRRNDQSKSRAAYLEQLGHELADTIIYADLLAIEAGIDLGAAIREKFDIVSRRYGSEVFLNATA